MVVGTVRVRSGGVRPLLLWCDIKERERFFVFFNHIEQMNDHPTPVPLAEVSCNSSPYRRGDDYREQQTSVTVSPTLGQEEEEEEEIVNENPTPLPLAEVIVVSAVAGANGVCLMMIFPFLPFMVSEFFPELSKEELGFQAGYVASAYFLGQVATSVLWGQLSDTFGRKSILVIGLSLTAGATLMFGASKSFTISLASRVLVFLSSSSSSPTQQLISQRTQPLGCSEREHRHCEDRPLRGL